MTTTALYRDHLTTLDRHLTDALERSAAQGAGFDGVVFHAGRLAHYHADDKYIPFQTAAHFRRWAPPLDGPEHLVLARPGKAPKVVRVTPSDYWYDVSPAPLSHWEEAVELMEASSFEAAVKELGDLSRCAWVGPLSEAAEAAGAGKNYHPETLMFALDWWRAYKTDYEVECTIEACKKAAAGHLKARKSFKAWGSEREIHWDYLRASEQLEAEVPYETIVALDTKSAILHYQMKRGPEHAPGKVLLLDAGAAHFGYASDITRTWASPDADPVFHEILQAVDLLERGLVAMVTVGRSYVEIHEAAHRGIATILAETGVVKTSAEEAFDAGFAHIFMPHGVGHHLGLQVHDVGGHQQGPEGGRIAPPKDSPALRNTRTIEEGHMLTIEPGLYFIPMLLDPERESARGKNIDWDLVERLLPCGGVRIEDDVLATTDGPRDLTRDLVEGPRGE